MEFFSKQQSSGIYSQTYWTLHPQRIKVVKFWIVSFYPILYHILYVEYIAILLCIFGLKSFFGLNLNHNLNHNRKYIYIYIYIYIYQIGRFTKRFVFFEFIYLFCSYICVCFQLVGFVIEHIWHKALLMRYSMRFELTRFCSLIFSWLSVSIEVFLSFSESVST